MIKKIAGLDEVGATLKELWLSYNSIEKLDGLEPCVKLHTLFISNNKIKDWPEISKLATLPELANILLVGNPIYGDMTKKQARPKVVEHLPRIQNVDGEMITGVDDDGEDGGDDAHADCMSKVLLCAFDCNSILSMASGLAIV